MKVEKDFISNGLRCVVVATDMGHRCGYVGIGKDHPLYGVEYGDHSPALKSRLDQIKDGPIGGRGIIPLIIASGSEDGLSTPDVFFDVHGSITFSALGTGPYFNAPDVWFFGFDCAHDGDAKDFDLYPDDKMKEFYRKHGWGNDGHIWTTEEVEAETIRLAEQLSKITP